MQFSWVSLQGTEQTFSTSLTLATKNGNKQRQNGINRGRVEVCLYCLTCSVLHLSTFTLDVLNLYYCVRLHYFSVWYRNLKSIFFCLGTWIVSLSGVRIQLMFQGKALQIYRKNLMTSLLMLRGKKRKHGLDRGNCRKKWYPSRKNWKRYRRNIDRHVSKQQKQE